MEHGKISFRDLSFPLKLAATISWIVGIIWIFAILAAIILEVAGI